MRKLHLALALLVLLGVVALRWPRPLPPGWTLLRPPHACFALHPAGEGMWVGSWDGLYLGTPEGLQEVPCDRRLQYVRALCRDRLGRLWVGHNAGLSCLDAGRWRHWEEPMVTSLVEDDYGRLWVGSQAGLRVQGGETVPLPGPEQRVACLMLDRDGGLWVGTESAFRGGLYRRDPEGRWQTMEGMPHPHVNCVVQAPDGDVWAGCGYLEDGGLARFAPGPWRRVSLLTRADGLPSSNVRSVRIEPSRLWIGFEFAGLVIREGEAQRAIDRLPHQEVLALCPDARGRLWVATRDGVLVMPDAP